MYKIIKEFLFGIPYFFQKVFYNYTRIDIYYYTNTLLRAYMHEKGRYSYVKSHNARNSYRWTCNGN